MTRCRSNNKKIGTAYEKEVVDLLSSYGYWSKRFEEDKRGAQPFDVIAVKNEIAYAIDAKTLDKKDHIFYLNRLEDNQITAFNHWIRCGNSRPRVFVKWHDETYVLDYLTLKENGKIDMYTAETFTGEL